MAYSIIQKSKLEGALRLDAEYYQQKYLKAKNKLSKIENTTRLVDIANILTGPAYSSGEIGEDFDIPLARIGDVTNKTDIRDWVKLSKKEFESFNNRKIKDLDILMTMTGDPPDVGKCNLIRIYDNSVIAFNQRVAKLSTKISPYYLFAYLSTKIVRLQSERSALGIRQRNVGINDLKSIRVVLPSNENDRVISRLIIYYLNRLKKSKFLYSQAENLLLEKLGLDDFKIPEELSHVVNFSDLESAKRIDADYFQPKYEKLISKIKNKNAKLLSKIIENVPAKFDPNLQPEKIFRYVELANINSSIGIIDGFSKVLGKEAPGRARRLLKSGDVIVSSIKGSLGKVALVDKEQEKSLASTGFFQFRSRKILPEVLLILAKSIVLQMQLERRTTGTILAAVPKNALKDVLIPILPKSTQQKIANLVKKSHVARKKSKELLEKAKREVEEMIEKGGE